jgi:hypothetical protein
MDLFHLFHLRPVGEATSREHKDMCADQMVEHTQSTVCTSTVGVSVRTGSTGCGSVMFASVAGATAVVVKLQIRSCTATASGTVHIGTTAGLTPNTMTGIEITIETKINRPVTEHMHFHHSQ